MPKDKSFSVGNIKITKRNTGIFFLILFHLVGLIGLVIPDTSLVFQTLTPLNLIVSLILVLSFHRDWNGAFYLYLFISFLLGYFVEVLGIQTGMIFGGYRYGESLGLKIFDTPLLIGINWMLLIYTCGSISSLILKNLYLKALLGTILMVILDYLIEPVAMRMDFWHWDSDFIPMRNYLGWALLSCILLLIYFLLPFHKQNRLVISFYFVQFFFFLAIRIILRL